MGAGRGGRCAPRPSVIGRPRRRGRRVVKVFDSPPFERLAHDAFKLPDQVVIVGRDECERVASPFGAPRATDAMDVGIGGIRHVKVDDVRDALNIKPTRRDIGGDHDAEMSALETAERHLALSLCAVAVQARDFMSGVCDLARDLIGAMFGAGEDQH